MKKLLLLILIFLISFVYAIDKVGKISEKELENDNTNNLRSKELIRSEKEKNSHGNSSRTIVYKYFGTDLNTSNSSTITPFGTYYHDGQNQILFTAAELTAAGVTENIESVGWNVVSASSGAMENFTIGIKHTTATAVNEFETGFTTVYNGTYTTHLYWNDFDFSTPFTWDGVSNVLIKVCFDNDGWTSDSKVRYTYYGENYNGYYYDDGGEGCSESYQSNTNKRPNTRFSIISSDLHISPSSWDFGSINSGYCSEDKNFSLGNDGVSALTITDVSITGADADHFVLTDNNNYPITTSNNINVNVKFCPTGDEIGDRNAYLQITESDNSITNAELTGMTTTVTLNDDCANAEVIEQCTDLPFHTLTATSSATGDMNNDIWFVYTPVYSGRIDIFLSDTDFDAEMGIYDECGGTALLYPYFSWSNHYQNAGVEDFLVAQGEDYYIAIGDYDVQSYETGVGKITITSPECSEPESLTHTAYARSIELGWTAGGLETTWNIEYGLAPLTQGTGTTIVADSNPFTIENLSTYTSYQFYVQAICPGVGTSNWVGPRWVTTLPDCDYPTDIVTSNISSSRTDVSWTPGADETLWNFMYDVAPFNQSTATVINDLSDPSITLMGLESNTRYSGYVQANCGGGDLSYLQNFSFTTSCPTSSLPISEAFASDYTPECWTNSYSPEWRFDTSTPWLWDLSDHTPGGGTNTAYVRGDQLTANNYYGSASLTSPFIDVSNANNLALDFYQFSNKVGSYDFNNILSVDFYDGNSWNEDVYSYSGNDPEWVYVNLELSSYTIYGNVQFRFVVTGVGSYYQQYNDIVIDDIYFTGTIVGPDAPEIIVPANGAEDMSLDTILDWEPSTDATGYKVTINDVMVASNVTDTYYVPTLEIESIYSWSVIAFNSNGSSISSECFAFTTNDGTCGQAGSGNNSSNTTLPVQIDIAPIVDNLGNFVDPNVSIDPEINESVTVSVTVNNENNNVPNPDNVSLSYNINVTGTVGKTIYITLFYTGMDPLPNELIWYNGSNFEQVSSAVFGPVSVTFPWTITASRAEDTFVLNEGGDSPLPVTLSTFSAIYQNSASSLHWTTQSENSNLGWNVFRSESEEFATGSLQNADLIDGAGTTSQPTNYIFNDPYPVIAGSDYWFWIESLSFSGQSSIFGPVSLSIPNTEPGQNTPVAPETFGLYQNYPNPFNPSTELSFALEVDANCELVIYNSKGRKVKTIFNGAIEANRVYSFIWIGEDENGKAVSSGIYYYKLKADKFEETRKMILLK